MPSRRQSRRIYSWNLGKISRGSTFHENYGMVVYSRNLTASRIDTHTIHYSWCESLGQMLITETEWIADRMRRTLPIDLLPIFPTFATKLRDLLNELQHMEENALVARSTMTAFFDEFWIGDTCGNKDWNIPAALMGRRDFHEKYTALRQSLRKGKDEWNQLCQKMTSHHATATYMKTLERPMHKVLATYNELLAGLDEFWWPPPGYGERRSWWEGQSIANDFPFGFY